MDRDKLKAYVAGYFKECNRTGPYSSFSQWHDIAETALAAIEDAGYAIVSVTTTKPAPFLFDGED